MPVGRSSDHPFHVNQYIHTQTRRLPLLHSQYSHPVTHNAHNAATLSYTKTLHSIHSHTSHKQTPLTHVHANTPILPLNTHNLITTHPTKCIARFIHHFRTHKSKPPIHPTASGLHHSLAHMPPVEQCTHARRAHIASHALHAVTWPSLWFHTACDTNHMSALYSFINPTLACPQHLPTQRL